MPNNHFEQHQTRFKDGGGKETDTMLFAFQSLVSCYRTPGHCWNDMQGLEPCHGANMKLYEQTGQQGTATIFVSNAVEHGCDEVSDECTCCASVRPWKV